MADNVLINTGTGPTIWTDQVGTRHAQAVKLLVGAADTADYIAFGQSTMTTSLPVVLASDHSPISVTGTAFTVANITTGNVSVVNVLSATGVLVASVATGTFTPTMQYSAALTGMGATATGFVALGIQTGATTGRAIAVTTTGALVVSFLTTQAVTAANVTVASLTTGTVSAIQVGTYDVNIVAGASAGKQYPEGTTIDGTGTGNLMMGFAVNTAKPILIHTTGGLIIASMPAVGGGQQYVNAATDMGATSTGTVIMGMQTGATTGRAIAITTTGGLVIGAMPAVGGGQQYAVDSTVMNATATGTVILGMQTGATTGRGIAVTTTGAQIISFVTTQAVTAANVTIASVTTGTMNVINVLSASGVTIASVTTGTMSVVNVLSAANVTIASVTTGTMNVINVLSATGVLLGATTAGVGAVVATAHASRWNACVISTTSGGGHVILKTSGAHTLYVTDLMVSVDVPMAVNFYSSSAAQAPQFTVYLATKGGFIFPLQSPMVLTSAQSLVFIGALSGSCAAYAGGYTVT